VSFWPKTTHDLRKTQCGFLFFRDATAIIFIRIRRGGSSGKFTHLTADSLTQPPRERAEDLSCPAPIWAPHVVHHDDRHWMFFTAIGEPRKIVLATCDDPSVESPYVVKRGDYYYLFISARPWKRGDGVEVFRSKSPFSWDPKKDFVKRWEYDKGHAMEVIQDLDGKWYMTYCGAGNKGWWITPLNWNDGLDKK